MQRIMHSSFGDWLHKEESKMSLALQFSDADAQLFQDCAAHNNISVFDFVRQAALARAGYEKVLENAKNLAEIDATIADFQKKKGSSITQEDMPKLLDMISDIRIEQIAAERIANDSDEGNITFEEMLAECGITQEDLDAIPDIEIE